jgi:LPPG:FO 2-phospho-L-lactate transferase
MPETVGSEAVSLTGRTVACVAMIVAIAGGVGAARLLRGMVRVVARGDLTAIVNTADDTVFHGLHVSPDLDTVTYTVAGAIDPERGWGLAGETWRAMDGLHRYARFGAVTWFNLGDTDLATHLFRTDRLRSGATLTEVTAEIAAAWDLPLQLLPMTDQPVETRVMTPEGELAFQEYFVGRRHDVDVSGVRFVGIENATPAAGVMDALAHAERIVICPSNPIVSIGPVLAVRGVRDALIARRDDVVAVSPIVGGAALKGPADRMLAGLGLESSVVGVARWYREFAATLVIDEVDAPLRDAVEAEGMRCVVTNTIMSTPAIAADLSSVIVDGTRHA